MATEHQIAANRLNALQSRGPKTAAGRAVSRRNALKHGLTARSLMIEGENPSQFEELRSELFDAYEPHGAIEEHLVDMMAGTMWRLRRVPGLEAAAFSSMQRCHGHQGMVGSDDAAVIAGLHRVTAKARQKKQNLGRAVFHLVRDGDLLDKLNRYEAQLLNQLIRISAELGNRRVKPAPPAAITALVAE